MPFAAAHRGLSAEKPENTLAAFGAAVAAGFPALELDLHATKDGVVVVLHDDTVDRTTDGSGRVDGMPWAKVQALETGAGGVPRLEDLLAMLRAWDGLYNLEVKAPEALEGTMELVARHGLAGRVCLSAMEPDILWHAQESWPDVPRAYIPLGPVEPDDIDLARDAGCRWMNVDHDFLDAEVASQVRNAGFRLGAWTVNDPKRALDLAGLGADCIITDVREVAAAVRGPASW
jgi:glycerophosphoryl diester phosphodiesterase